MTKRLSRRAVVAGLPLAVFPLAVVPLALAGCGFQPIYMPTASGKAGPAEREMAQVEVALIPERSGQILRQELQRRLASDNGSRHLYDLRVSFSIAAEGLSVTTDNLPTRVRMIGYASWVLVTNDQKRTKLTEGGARSFDGLNLFEQQYFAADMEGDAVTKRIANSIADQIAMQIAVYFRKQAARPQQAG